MPNLTPILIPLLNPNELEAILVDVFVHERQQVQAGEVLFTLETTKSTAEVTAEQSGYAIGLSMRAGETVRTGQVFGYLAESADAIPPSENPLTSLGAQPPANPPEGLRITQPAWALAQSLGLDLSQLPAGILVTESYLRRLQAGQAGDDHLARPASDPGVVGEPIFDPTALILYGGGGHGKALIELVRSLGSYHIAGILDDGLEAQTTILGLPVLGGGDHLPSLYQQGVRLALNAVGGIGNLSVRLKVAERLAQAGFVSPVVVHPSAVVEPSASLAAGVQVFALSYVGSEARIGPGVILNTGAIISHECTIGAYANLSPGAILAGQVEVGPGALVGMGVTVNLQVKIGANARIGNGATVKSDVPEGMIVRAGSIWPG
jgi:sugar O-acyltransferase (sialic acid O-acetyltransferase NeuD family)